jgi:hypothetical protein
VNSFIVEKSSGKEEKSRNSKSRGTCYGAGSRKAESLMNGQQGGQVKKITGGTIESCDIEQGFTARASIVGLR